MVCSVIVYPSVVQYNWHCNKCMPRYLMQFDLILKSFYCSFCSSARFIIGISFLHIFENSIRATHDIISKIQIKMEIIILVGAPLRGMNSIRFLFGIHIENVHFLLAYILRCINEMEWIHLTTCR